MQRSQKTIERLKKILEAAEEGASFDLPTEKDAINLRQKIYHFKRQLIAGRKSALKEIAERLVVSVDGNTLSVSTRLPDYMDALDDQI